MSPWALPGRGADGRCGHRAHLRRRCGRAHRRRRPDPPDARQPQPHRHSDGPRHCERRDRHGRERRAQPPSAAPTAEERPMRQRSAVIAAVLAGAMTGMTTVAQDDASPRNAMQSLMDRSSVAATFPAPARREDDRARIAGARSSRAEPVNRDTSRPWPAPPTVDGTSTVARPVDRRKDVLRKALTLFQHG